MHKSVIQFRSLLSSLKIRIYEQSDYGKGIRLILFIILYFLSRYLTHNIDSFDFNDSFWGTGHLFLAKIISTLSCWILKPFYPSIEFSSNLSIIIDNKEVLLLLPACTGFDQIVRMMIVLVFYPIPPKSKIWLGPVSVCILVIAATIHFTILIPVASTYPRYYNFFHSGITLVIFYSLYFSCWLIWEKYGFKKKIPNRFKG